MPAIRKVVRDHNSKCVGCFACASAAETVRVPDSVKHIAHKVSTNIKSDSQKNMKKTEVANAEEVNTQKLICKSNSAEAFHIRKCRVRIKRFPIKLNKHPLNKTNYEEEYAEEVNTQKSVSKSIGAETFHIRKCCVRIKRVKLELNKNLLNNTVADNSVFEPARNSTMYLTKPLRVSLKRLRTPQATEAAAEKIPDKAKTAHRFFHRDQPPTRTRSSVTRNVYEFLSESQIDDSATNQRKDAAADIIKKMVEDGRACAIIRSKTGKNRVRRVAKKVRPVGKRKQCSLKATTAKSQVEQPIHMETRPLSPIYEPEQEEQDNQSDAAPVANEAAAQIQSQQLQEPLKRISMNKSKTTMEGAYSPLARSLLLNQTNNQNAQNSLDRRRQLLQVARKFYSTPMNRKNVTAQNDVTFSPIPHQAENTQPVIIRSPSGGSSPWRVPDEAPLPNTFMFGFNTSQLPSYSSDHIRKKHVYIPDKPLEHMENDGNDIVSETSIDSAANDSNGENVPPAMPSVNITDNNNFEKTIPPIELSGQENENDENFVQLPNPRRTLQQRTPLKDINILDVVVLPSWKNKMQLPKTPIKNHVHFEDSIDKTISKSPRQQLGVQAARQTQSPRNLFGFEDFLNEGEQQCNSVHTNQTNITLVDKMQRLKDLRPKDRELPQVSKAPLRYDYDDLTAGTPKQRNIKEMLCSTMIATPLPALPANESIGLFADTDPEVTFDEKKPRRTYVRERPKRRRKQRVQVLFIETDSSDNDENEEQDSNDKSADSPRKAAPEKKRARRDVEHEAKLRQFISSFRQECEEVEKFPLIIE
ncbi:protein dalmatian [Drosophila albomicans]|uniref:Protein dalmatian n=1 Tax=Drosophila albomicans TaxID=7291 RepID=A0A6P8XJW2_DROAB|nr:protein dalmatian [Drosophila albomicans]